jgi:hypothetical protein
VRLANYNRLSVVINQFKMFYVVTKVKLLVCKSIILHYFIIIIFPFDDLRITEKDFENGRIAWPIIVVDCNTDIVNEIVNNFLLLILIVVRILMVLMYVENWLATNNCCRPFRAKFND